MSLRFIPSLKHKYLASRFLSTCSSKIIPSTKKITKTAQYCIRKTRNIMNLSINEYTVEIDNGYMKVQMPKIDSSDGNNNDNITESNSLRHDVHIDAITVENSSDDKTEEATGSADIQIPESVLQFQRQMRKVQAAKRASTPLLQSQLQVLYSDDHMCVVNKPSGVLSVPGVNSNPSMLTLVYERYMDKMKKDMKRDHMIIHRLDMDTSGVIIFAITKTSMTTLQKTFRERKVDKMYEALVCGHIDDNVQSGIIDLPLQRDHRYPPFMRVATPRSEREAKEVVKDLQHAGWKKIVKKNAKPSQTYFSILNREYVTLPSTEGDESSQEHQILPVTRVKLVPHTGRTHQLRVHMAALGHPILGDPTYGVYGEASANAGFSEKTLDQLIPTRASLELQLKLNQYVTKKKQVMCLHARKLELMHPVSGDPIVFEEPPSF